MEILKDRRKHRQSNTDVGRVRPYWSKLKQLSDRIFRHGFDYERILISTRHEIRSLACRALDDQGNHVAIVGDKQGCCYATIFSMRSLQDEVPRSGCWSPPGRRVIDDILIVPCTGNGEYGAVLATRGEGAWITPLDAVLQDVREGKDLRAAKALIQLPESEGRSVDRLVYDASSRSVLAVARHGSNNELFVWSLSGPMPELVSRESFPYALTALAIDKAEQGAMHDELFVATGRFELYRIKRTASQAPFHVTSQEMLEGNERVRLAWRGDSLPSSKCAPSPMWASSIRKVETGISPILSIGAS